MRFTALGVSVWLSAAAVLTGVTSILIGRRVNDIDHLALFNAMAIAILAFSAGAIGAGVAGIWRSRGRSPLLWFASALAVAVVALVLLDD